MPLTKEQLLIPRYNVIADYPGCPYDIGTILVVDEDGELYSQVAGYSGSKLKITTQTVSRFPHLVQPLPWWSDRKIEDMPEYVRYSTYYLNHYHLAGYPQYENKIFKIEKWEYGHYGMKAIGEGIIHPYEINFYPVDEEEHTAYINQKQ